MLDPRYESLSNAELEAKLRDLQAMQLEWIEEYKTLQKTLPDSPRNREHLAEKNQEIIELNMIMYPIKLLLAKRDMQSIGTTSPLPPLPEAEITRLLQTGQEYSRKNEIHLSIATFNQILRHHPQSVEALFERGMTLVKAQDFRTAIVDFSAIIQLQPDHIEAYRARGDANSRLREWRAVIEDETTLLYLKPDDPDAYRERGLAYFMLKQLPPSIADLTRAVELDPTNASAYYFRAGALMDDGQYEAALADCEQAHHYNAHWSLPTWRMGEIRKKMAAQSESNG